MNVPATTIATDTTQAVPTIGGAPLQPPAGVIVDSLDRVDHFLRMAGNIETTKNAVAAAVEFKMLLDIQRGGELRNPWGPGDARHGLIYTLATHNLIAAAVECAFPKNSSLPPLAALAPCTLAISAAVGFLSLLDMQPAGSLFFPGRKDDARLSRTYAVGRRLLLDALTKSVESAKSHGLVLNFFMPIRDVVADHGANSPSNEFGAFQQIRTLLLELGLQERRQLGGGGKDGGFLEFRFSDEGKVDETSKPGHGNSDAVHI